MGSWAGDSHFLHVEIIFSDAAIRACPRFGHIFPAGSWRNAVLRQAGRFVVNEAAYHAHPSAERGGVGIGCLHDAMSQMEEDASLSHSNAFNA